MRFIFCLLLAGAVSFSTTLSAQSLPDSALIQADIQGWMNYLTSDSMKGRVEGSAENRAVTDSIAAYFEAIGLKPFLGSSFKQSFYKHPTDSTLNVSNVIGWLPGVEKPEEYILISAHIDHVQIGYYHKTDKIYNGANDNASGTSVMLALARQLVLTAPHSRSIIFCGFNAEESGLIGSTAFAEKIDAAKIIAGINVEMLGFPQFGKNTFMVTGMRQSNLHTILRSNLKGTNTRIRRERGNLFERSDNYPLAKKGIPAHTIMASDDREPCYHRPCDELKRMHIPNMVTLAMAIQQAISSIIEGRDTPTRINLR